jgi:hypothetical protein
MKRSKTRRFGPRLRDRFSMRSWCFNTTDSAITERNSANGNDDVEKKKE